jgi:hypothetical protein
MTTSNSISIYTNLTDVTSLNGILWRGEAPLSFLQSRYLPVSPEKLIRIQLTWQSASKTSLATDSPARRFASDSPLEGTGFEPVWGFSCQVVFWFVGGSLFGAGKPFFVPSPAIRFVERAEGVKGPKR